MDKVTLRTDADYRASFDARWNFVIRTPLLKFWWRWDISAKPETALDVRITPAMWFRLFYFRHRPKRWYENSFESKREAPRKGRVIFDWPSLYPVDAAEVSRGQNQ